MANVYLTRKLSLFQARNAARALRKAGYFASVRQCRTHVVNIARLHTQKNDSEFDRIVRIVCEAADFAFEDQEREEAEGTLEVRSKARRAAILHCLVGGEANQSQIVTACQREGLGRSRVLTELVQMVDKGELKATYHHARNQTFYSRK